jgi:hypothetical protein
MFLGAHSRANHRIWIKLNHQIGLFSTLICTRLVWTDSFLNCCAYIHSVVLYEERAASLIRSETDL